MKKGLKITVITIAVIGVLIIAFLVFVGSTAGPKLLQGKTEVKTISVEIMENVVKTGQYSDFSKYSNAELQVALQKDDTQKIFQIYNEKLGKLVAYDEPQVTSINTMSGGNGNAMVVVNATFDKGGSATVELEFIRNSTTGEWTLNSFNFDSPSFL